MIFRAPEQGPGAMDITLLSMREGQSAIPPLKYLDSLSITNFDWHLGRTAQDDLDFSNIQEITLKAQSLLTFVRILRVCPGNLDHLKRLNLHERATCSASDLLGPSLMENLAGSMGRMTSLEEFKLTLPFYKYGPYHMLDCLEGVKDTLRSLSLRDVMGFHKTTPCAGFGRGSLIQRLPKLKELEINIDTRVCDVSISLSCSHRAHSLLCIHC